MPKADSAIKLPDQAVQLAVALTLLAGSAIYLYAALGFSFGSWSNPHSGFLPTITGWAGVALALLNIVRVWHSRTPEPAEFGAKPAAALAFAAILVAYAFLLGQLGFLPTTFLGALALLLVGRRLQGLVGSLVIASLFSLGAWLLFGTVLDLPLP